MSKRKRIYNIIKVKKDLVFGIFSFLLPFGVYYYTLCPTVSVYADAGEFPTMAYVSGFGHPSGYPLFILILKLFLLMPFGQPAWKANLVSAFMAATACLLFYFLLKFVTRDHWASLAGTLILAFSRIFWRNALFAEVFSLVGLFSVLTFLLFLYWQKTQKKKYFYLFILACGFGIGHHQILAISLFPLLVWFLFKIKDQNLNLKDCVKALFLFSSGYLPYLYIFLAAQKRPLMNWENPQNLHNLFRLALRANYGFLQITPIIQKITYSAQFLGSLKILSQSFTEPVIVLFLLITVASFKKYWRYYLWSFFILLGSLWVWIYSKIPFNQLVEFPYLERFQILSCLAVALVLGIGFKETKESLKKNIRIPIMGLNLLFFVLPALIFQQNYLQVSQKGNYFGEYFAEDLLREVDQGSIFLFEGDPAINSLFYYQQVLGKRPDVKLVIGDLLISNLDWYFQELNKFYPEVELPERYQNPQQFLLDFVVINSEKQPIFINLPNLEKKLGLHLVKKLTGMNWRFSPMIPGQDLENELLSLIEKQKDYLNLSQEKYYYPEWPETSIMATYARPQIELAINYENINDFSRAKSYYLQAIKICPYHTYAWTRLADILISEGQIDMAIRAWEKALLNPADKDSEIEIKEDINHYQSIKY